MKLKGGGKGKGSKKPGERVSLEISCGGLGRTEGNVNTYERSNCWAHKKKKRCERRDCGRWTRNNGNSLEMSLLESRKQLVKPTTGSK